MILIYAFMVLITSLWCKTIFTSDFIEQKMKSVLFADSFFIINEVQGHINRL